MNTRVLAHTTPKTTWTPLVRSNRLQRKCACGGTPGPTGECEECHKKRLQRKVGNPKSKMQSDSWIPPIVDEALRSTGQPLDAVTRAFMEPRFGHDFGNVRVHTHARAAASAKAINAQAYTVGHNVVFGENKYAPTTQAGRELLAHELTHVVQHGDASAGLVQNHHGSGPAISQPGGRAEQEADRGAEAVATGGSFAPSVKAAPGAAGATIHRADEEWNKAYGKHKSFLQKPFDEFKAGLGEIKSTTEGGLT